MALPRASMTERTVNGSRDGHRINRNTSGKDPHPHLGLGCLPADGTVPSRLETAWGRGRGEVARGDNTVGARPATAPRVWVVGSSGSKGRVSGSWAAAWRGLMRSEGSPIASCRAERIKRSSQIHHASY